MAKEGQARTVPPGAAQGGAASSSDAHGAPAPRTPTMVGASGTVAGSHARRIRPRALLAVTPGPVAQATQTAFSALPLEVHVLPEGRSVVESIQLEPADVLVLDPACLGPAPLETLAQLKQREDPPFVLAVVSRFSPKGLAALLDGGVDDFARVPLSLDELLVRIRRVRARAGRTVVVPTDTMAARMAHWPSLANLPAALARDFREFTHLAFDAAPASAEPVPQGVGATLCLTHPDGVTEVTIGVEMSHDLGGAMVMAVLGLPSDRNVLSELLREVANLAGGAAKRCLLQDGVAFTTGLPVERDVSTARAAGAALLEWELVAPEGRIKCSVAMTRVVRLNLPLASLKEGHVVAREVRSPSGVLVAPAGARLTRAAIAMMVKALPPDAFVEIVQGE